MNDYFMNSPLYKNTKIKTVEIHEGITHIGTTIFCRCTSITSISIPSSVSSIGDNPFSRSLVLTTIILNDNKYFLFEEDCLYDKNKTRLIIFQTI